MKSCMIEVKCGCKGRSHVCKELSGLMRVNSDLTIKTIWYKSKDNGYLASKQVKVEVK